MKKRLKNTGRAGGEERTRIFKRFLKEVGLFRPYIQDRLIIKQYYKAANLKPFSPCMNYGTPSEVLYNALPSEVPIPPREYWKFLRGCLVYYNGSKPEFEILLDEMFIENIKRGLEWKFGDSEDFWQYLA